MKANPVPDAASFRDPDGYVFRVGERVFRALRRSGLDLYQTFRESEAAQWGERQGLITRSWELKPEERVGIGELPSDVVSVLEQERIPFLNYPYEWSFDMLKDAALLQIDLLLGMAQYQFTLKDATAFNIQFVGAKPIFIDVLSFMPYKPGTPWIGYAQFCQGLLYPLALKALAGVDFQPILRSYPDGIPIALVKKILGIRAWLHPGMFKHVVLQSALQRSFAKKTPDLAKEFEDLQFSLNHVVGLLRAIKGQVARLSPRQKLSHWASYQEERSYLPQALEHKRAFVRKHLETIAASTVWDLGCNTGEFSLLAADCARQVIALDADPDSVNKLYLHCRHYGISRILPLVSDLTNPSPALGWNQRERVSLLERGKPECILALALIHHLCLIKNVPFSRIFELFARLEARHVIIEFIPKSDPMVKELLVNREDVYPWYTQSVFEKEAAAFFSIGDRLELEKDGRLLYWLIRRSDAQLPAQ